MILICMNYNYNSLTTSSDLFQLQVSFFDLVNLFNINLVNFEIDQSWIQSSLFFQAAFRVLFVHMSELTFLICSKFFHQLLRSDWVIVGVVHEFICLPSLSLFNLCVGIFHKTECSWDIVYNFSEANQLKEADYLFIPSKLLVEKLIVNINFEIVRSNLHVFSLFPIFISVFLEVMLSMRQKMWLATALSIAVTETKGLRFKTTFFVDLISFVIFFQFLFCIIRTWKAWHVFWSNSVLSFEAHSHWLLIIFFISILWLLNTIFIFDSSIKHRVIFH